MRNSIERMQTIARWHIANGKTRRETARHFKCTDAQVAYALKHYSSETAPQSVKIEIPDMPAADTFMVPVPREKLAKVAEILWR